MRFWMSWYGGENEPDLQTPWWITGWRTSDMAPTICAAVIAEDESAARALVAAASAGVQLEWRFCDPKPETWSPFCDRMRRAPWMQWPD